MKYLLWAGITFLTFGIQGSISLFDITPNFTVILASYAGIREKELKGLFFGSLIGIVEDSLSGTFLGPNLLSKGLVGYLAAFLYRALIGLWRLYIIWSLVLGNWCFSFKLPDPHRAVRAREVRGASAVP